MDTKYSMEDEGYGGYRNAIQNSLNSRDITSFKSNPSYQGILEHVDQPQGEQYYKLIQGEFHIPNERILAFCKMNDSSGNPTKYYIPGLDFRVSPTSLRYIFHALLILDHIRSLGLASVKIIEIGAGYGGLLLAISHFSSSFTISVEKYICIDLTEAINLQQVYTTQFDRGFPVEFVDAMTYGSPVNGDDFFLISNYCITELVQRHRDSYMNTLLPKITHGFIAWNTIPVYDFGRPILKSVPERPNTGPNNMFVYF